MIDAAGAAPRRGAVAAGALLVGLFGLVIGGLGSSFAYDDAWITYRYALNLASGDGLVYNAGERVFGTTAPGYAVLLGVLAWPSPESVPAISGAVCAIALAAAGLALYTYGVRRDAWLAGVVAALVFIVNPLALEAFGGEMVPQAALALWALVAVALDRPALAVACGVGATLLRPDGAIVLVWALGWHVWRARRVPWRVVAVAGLVLALWFGALWFYFGSPLPATLAAKQAQRASGVWRGFGTDFVLWVLSLTTMPSPFLVARTHGGFTPFLALSLAGLLLLPWRRRWWGLIAWPLPVCLAYRQLRLPFYHWYAVPPLALLAVTAGLYCEAVAQGGAAIARRWWPGGGAVWRPGYPAIAAATVAIVLVVVVRPLSAFPIATRDWFPGPGERGYIDIGRWLAANTPGDASVGYIEVGFVGYHSRRRIVDPFGLVTKDAGARVAAGDFLWAYRQHRPDVILHSPVLFPAQMALEQEAWFAREYRAAATLDSGRGYPLTVYRRIAPSAK